MSFEGVLVTEIFRSLQGESSEVGLPYAFVRLTGCNLRCTYCDTSYAFKGGRRMAIQEVVREVSEIHAPLRPARPAIRRVLITGGEPLLQRKTPELVDTLTREGFQVCLETHGELPIANVAGKARIIMDIKTPSSGQCRGGFLSNLKFLGSTDEVKFVIASEQDYLWARSVLMDHPIPCPALFSTATPAPAMPGQFPGVAPSWLAERILEDGLEVRFQLQLHKALWGPDAKGR